MFFLLFVSFGSFAASFSAHAGQNVQAYFSDPKHVLFTTKEDHSLEDRIVQFIRAAAPGTRIRASIYQAGDDRLARELVAASRRGVDVRLVLDDAMLDPDYAAFYGKVMEELPAGSIHVCSHGACIGDKNNHNKFYIFSGGNIVIQSSANLTASQRRKHNNMVVVRDDEKLFAAYEKHWENLFFERRSRDYLHGADGQADGSGATPVHVYFYPALDDEPVLDILKHSKCAPSSGEVYLVHSETEGEYAHDVLQELIRLRKSGCKVGLVLRSDPDSNELINEFRKSGLDVAYNGGFTMPGIHSKYLLLNADVEMDGRMARRRFVFTGSANLKEGAVFKNDETVIRVEDDAIFAAYKADYLKIRKQTLPPQPKGRPTEK